MYSVVVFVATEALCAINPGVKMHRKYNYQTHFEHMRSHDYETLMKRRLL